MGEITIKDQVQIGEVERPFSKSFCILAQLATRALIALCSELCFQGCLYSKLPWKIEIVSLQSQRQVGLLSGVGKKMFATTARDTCVYNPIAHCKKKNLIS